MREQYENPLCRRYASREMQEIFSDARKFSTWRKLWVALAESEKELGLDITDAQIAEMKAHLYDIDFAVADAREREVRHDVMAHIYAYGQVCPNAKPIIHLGAHLAPRRHLLLRRGQYRPDPAAGRTPAHPLPADSHDCGAGGFCRPLPGASDPCLDALSGGTADNRGKAGNAVDAGSDDGS